jgi:hypothetical protein
VSKPYFPDPPKPAAQSPFRERGHGAASSEAPAAEPVVVRRVEPVEDRFAPIAPTPTLRASKPANPAAARLAAERNPGNPKVEAMSPESRRELAETLIVVDRANHDRTKWLIPVFVAVGSAAYILLRDGRSWASSLVPIGLALVGLSVHRWWLRKRYGL